MKNAMIGNFSGLQISGFLSLFPILLVLAACNGGRDEEIPAVPVFQRVTWEGRLPIRHISDSVPALGEQDIASGIIRVHSLDFLGEDTLRLILSEFSRDYLAYRAFQEKATAEEIREGFYREKNSIFFIQGVFLGELRYVRSGLVPASFLKERLSFQNEELFRRPDIFSSFPLAARLPFSERVVSSDFLGQKGMPIAFTASYPCHGDTATLFRGFEPYDSLPDLWIAGWKGETTRAKWSSGRRFSGLQEGNIPVLFWIFKGGVLGIQGCFDPVLARDYAEKMEKMTILVPNP